MPLGRRGLHILTLDDTCKRCVSVVVRAANGFSEPERPFLETNKSHTEQLHCVGILRIVVVLLFCFVGLLVLVRVPAPNVLLLPVRPLVVVKTHAKPHPRHRPSLEVRVLLLLLLLLLARPRWGIGPGSRRCGIPVAATASTTTSSRDDQGKRGSFLGLRDQVGALAPERPAPPTLAPIVATFILVLVLVLLLLLLLPSA